MRIPMRCRVSQLYRSSHSFSRVHRPRLAVGTVVILLFSVGVLGREASPRGLQAAARNARQVYARAIDLESAGNYAAAISLLWEAAGLAPQDAEIQNRLGEGLERLGVLDAAADAYRAAVAARPGFLKATNNLILVLVKA